MPKNNLTEDLYIKHLAALQEKPLVLQEQPSGGVHRSSFFEAIAGMGERAIKRGTIARSVRPDKK